MSESRVLVIDAERALRTGLVDEVLPEVRDGMATGRVVPRLGDVFGTTVNRASRLTAVARPRSWCTPSFCAIPIRCAR